jgi:leucyl/phenylalanyl-tRNA--protein transferase
MFSRERDASKVALVHLVARLKAGGFRLLDTQFITDHLASFGAEEISRADYAKRLAQALAADADFGRIDRYAGGGGEGFGPGVGAGVAAMQLISQAS